MSAPLRALIVPRTRFSRRRIFARTPLHQRLLGAVTLLIALAAGTAFARAATPAVIKTPIIVEGSQITLADLFDSDAFVTTPEVGSVVVAAAPAPGQDITLDAGQIRAQAQTHGVEWLNAERLDSVAVHRAGAVIGAAQIESTLVDAFAAHGFSPKTSAGTIRVRFAGASPALMVAIGSAQTVSVDSLEIDERTGQFRASVRAPANDARAPQSLLIGRAYEATNIPILTRDVSVGEKLAAQDFSLTEVPIERVGQNTLTDMSRLDGMTPRRMLRAGQPLHQGDVTVPVVVAKNELVAMIVRVSGMSLTAQGRALDDGALNSTIRVMNTQSKRTVQATVTGPGEVSVVTTAGSQAIASR